MIPSMDILVYEFLTGGGMLGLPGAPLPTGSLLREGAAMSGAISEDLAAMDGVTVIRLIDSRLSPEQVPPQGVGQVIAVDSRRAHDSQLATSAASANYTLLIAPEIDGQLAEVAGMVSSAGGRLLGPNLDVIRWASDKTATVERLAACGIATPASWRSPYEAERDGCKGPIIVKPVDGAGCTGVTRYDSIHSLLKKWNSNSECDASQLRIESFRSGHPASVALLTGPTGVLPLAACSQHIEWKKCQPVYRGGAVITDPSLALRCQDLAFQVAELLADCQGYIGVDLILGPADDGSQDAVIDVNPRLTTSYVGLRAATPVNLAAAMLAHARGEPVELPPFEAVEFWADGRVERLAASKLR